MPDARPAGTQNANIPEVKYFDSAYYVFATAAGNGEFHRQEKIEYFTSKDGAIFSKATDLLAPQVDFDAWGMLAPTLVVERDTIVMFYSGWSYVDHPCFPEPLPLNVRFGRPSNGDAACIFGSFGRAVAPRPTTHLQRGLPNCLLSVLSGHDLAIDDRVPVRAEHQIL